MTDYKPDRGEQVSVTRRMRPLPGEDEGRSYTFCGVVKDHDHRGFMLDVDGEAPHWFSFTEVLDVKVTRYQWRRGDHLLDGAGYHWVFLLPGQELVAALDSWYAHNGTFKSHCTRVDELPKPVTLVSRAPLKAVVGAWVASLEKSFGSWKLRSMVYRPAQEKQ